MRFIFILIMVISIMSVNVYGDGELSSFDTKSIENTAREETGLSFSSIFYSLITGSPSDIIEDIKDSITDVFFKEIKDNSAYIKAIIIISLLCGVLNTVTVDLKDKTVSEIVFYVGEVLVITLAATAFREAIDVLKSAVSSIINIINSAIPFMISVVAATGRSVTSLTSGGILAMTTSILGSIINGVVIPLITMSTIINIVNLISRKDMLGKMSSLLKDVTGYIIKGGGYIFVFLMSFERIGGGAVNKLVGNSVKSAVGAVPVIGDVIEGGVEIAAGVAGSVATGSGVVIVILLFVSASVPVMKIGIITAIYKVLAALVEPICDKNTVEIIDTIGEGAKLILACLFMVLFMFVVSALVILGGLT